MISVIVVTYCQEDTLGRTLDSILAQELDCPYEILVSDDCSSDSTVDVARRYAERYPEIVRVHVNERNLGVQANYFGAMRRAKGELIADCAGDDYWCDCHKLQRQLDILRIRADVSLVHTGFEYEDPDGRRERFLPVGERPPFEPGVRTLRKILTDEDKPYIHLCTALYRKAPILKALDESPELFLNPEYKCEDLQVECTAGASGEIAYIPEATLIYSRGHESISSEDNYAKNFEFYFATTKLRLQLLRRYGIGAEATGMIIGRYVDYLMSQAFHEGNKVNALRLRKWMEREGVRSPLKARIYEFLLWSGMSRGVSTLIRGAKTLRRRESATPRSQ